MAQPHVILFEHVSFRGGHKHVIGAQGEHNLNDSDDNDFNDEGTQSFIILEGNWNFFKDSEFKHQVGETLGPDLYPTVAGALGSAAKDRLSSLQPVNFLPVGRAKKAHQ